MKAASLLALLTVALPLLAQPPPPGQMGRQDVNRPGPWDNDVLVYRVDADGRSEKLATFERAGVPTLARLKDGRLISAFQHFPKDDDRNFDRVAVRFSSDEGRTWTAATPIVVEGMEAGLARPFDPTLVPLPDGRVRLYFTSNRSPDFRRSTPAIYSAISTNGGIQYVFEPGVRFAVEGRIVIDCAAALHNGVFHLFVPDNGSAEDFMGGQQRHEPPRGGVGYHATSKDGLKFTRVEDVKISGNHRWLGNAQSDGKLITFFGTAERPARPGQARGGVWAGTSADGSAWELLKLLDVPGADPGAVAARDGGWIITVTGPPRSGTFTDRQRQQRMPAPPPRGEPR